MLLDSCQLIVEPFSIPKEIDYDQPFLEAVSPSLYRFIGGLKVDSGTELARFMNGGNINYRFSNPLTFTSRNEGE